jgi:hypothetical protein
MGWRNLDYSDSLGRDSNARRLGEALKLPRSVGYKLVPAVILSRAQAQARPPGMCTGTGRPCQPSGRLLVSNFRPSLRTVPEPADVSGELAASYAPVAVLAAGECISTQSDLHDKPLLESVGIMDILALPAKLRP